MTQACSGRPQNIDGDEARPGARSESQGRVGQRPARTGAAQGAPWKLWAATCAIVMGGPGRDGDAEADGQAHRQVCMRKRADSDQEDASGTDQDSASTASAGLSGSWPDDSDASSDAEDGASPRALEAQLPNEAPAGPVAPSDRYGRGVLLSCRRASLAASSPQEGARLRLVLNGISQPVPTPSAPPRPRAATAPALQAPSLAAAAQEPRDSSGELVAAQAAARASADAVPALLSGSWAAQQRRKREEAKGAHPGDEDIARSVKSILNKLTVEKFEALYTKLISCGILTPANVELLVGEIFGKATTQHHFVRMYADLCARLERDLSASAGCNFRRILLDQCQVSFESSLEPPPDAAGEGQDVCEARAKQKERILGNIKLIGELLSRKMLSSRVLISCAEDLLQGPPEADRLESLAALLKATGSTFDDPAWPHHGALAAIFMSVDSLSRDPLVPSRVRCLFKDVIELRAANWMDTKRATRVEAPRRLEDVHREAAAEVFPGVQHVPAKWLAEAGATATNHKSGLPTGSPKHPPSGSPKHSPNGSPPKVQPQPYRAARAHERGQANDTNAGGNDFAALIKGSTPSSVVSQPKVRHAHDVSPPTTSAASVVSRKRQQPKAVFAEAAVTPSELAPLPLAPPSRSQVLRPELPTPPAPLTPPAPTFSPAPPAEASGFDLADFHRQLSASMRELAATRDAASAVRRFKAARLPTQYHAAEFCNILTRSVEEPTGGVRRVCFAFLASLAEGTLDKAACAEGAKAFLEDVFDDLCDEVPGLPSILAAELVPTLRGSLPSKVIDSFRRHLPLL